MLVLDHARRVSLLVVLSETGHHRVAYYRRTGSGLAWCLLALHQSCIALFLCGFRALPVMSW